MAHLMHFDSVVDDERLGARLVVDHLVALGHRRILHTSQASGAWEGDFVLSHTARRQGFEQAMRNHNLEPDTIQTYYSEEGGYEAALQAFARDDRPSAIFAGADIAALGVLRAAEEHGLRIPGDLTVVGYDNIYTSTINRVSLTTVDQSGHLTGAASIRLLLERIDGRTEAKQVVVTPQLVPRRTSGPPNSDLMPRHHRHAEPQVSDPHLSPQSDGLSHRLGHSGQSSDRVRSRSGSR